MYGSEVVSFELAREGRVDYAQWLHPAETRKTVSQAAVDELRTFLRPGDVAVDVGAHSGDTTIPIALAVGSEGCVLALEPNPYVFPVLQRNAALNHDKTTIRALNFAATAGSGLLELEYSDAGYCNGGRHQGISRWRHGHAFPLTVQGENLSSYLHREARDLLPRLRYIKTDAEGYDLVILESIEDLLASARPHLRVEVFGQLPRDQRRRLVEYLRRLDYDLFRIRDETCYRSAPLTDADVSSALQFDLFAVPSSGGLT